jgi:hypothetical protein
MANSTTMRMVGSVTFTGEVGGLGDLTILQGGLDLSQATGRMARAHQPIRPHLPALRQVASLTLRGQMQSAARACLRT